MLTALFLCRPSHWRQFGAVLHKNVLLQTRSSRSLLGAGWAALAFEVLTPAAFFLLMCLPKYYFDVKPQPIPTELFQATDLDMPTWANTYQGAQRSWQCHEHAVCHPWLPPGIALLWGIHSLQMHSLFPCMHAWMHDMHLAVHSNLNS